MGEEDTCHIDNDWNTNIRMLPVMSWHIDVQTLPGLCAIWDAPKHSFGEEIKYTHLRRIQVSE